MAETTTRRTPRRRPAAEDAPAVATTDTPTAEPQAPAEKPAPARPARDDDDPNIGRAVPASWDEAGFDNGHRYRCEGGRVVERIG